VTSEAVDGSRVDARRDAGDLIVNEASRDERVRGFVKCDLCGIIVQQEGPMSLHKGCNGTSGLCSHL
jgi:hypothetical protein